jgi:hypothetical protein
MTTTDIPTTTVDVPDIGNVGEADLDRLTAAQLHAVLKVLGLPAPKGARKPELHGWAVNGLRLQAMTEQATRPVAAIEPPAEHVALEHPGGHVVPTLTRWQQIQAMAEYLSRSNLTPEVLRGKPHDVGHILLKANDLGVPLTMALDQMYVIQGRVGMESKLMRALIRRDGHNLKDLGCDGFRARVWGKRKDNGDEHVGEFTLDDAKDQNLVAGYDEVEAGVFATKPVMNNGKSMKPQWQKDTKNMLTERATARLARFLFSDCLAGVSYTPDEIDDLGYIDAEGDAPKGRAGEPEPTVTINHQRKDIARRLGELPEDLRIALRDQRWKPRNFPKPDDLRPAMIGQALKWLDEFEALARERDDTSGVETAEVVDEDRPADAGGDDGGDAVEPDASLGEVGAESPATSLPSEICAGCHEAIPDDAPPVYGNDDLPYHIECSPYA